MSYLIRLIAAYSQFANALAGGEVDSTVSRYTALAYWRGVPGAAVLCRLLSLFEADHCRKAAQADKDEPFRYVGASGLVLRWLCLLWLPLLIWFARRK